MSNGETPYAKELKTSEVMALADRRVNVAKEDIPREQKVKIVELENTVLDFMRDPNYAEMREAYKKNYDTTGRGAEGLLATMKAHYMAVESGESKAAGDQLKAITTMALSELEELKMNMGFAAADTERDARRYNDVIGKSTGADRPIAPASELPENMATVEELLGRTPREKIEVNLALNEGRLAQLKLPENAAAYVDAKLAYASITGGQHLEDATKLLSDAFSAGLKEVAKRTGLSEQRALLLELVSTQLNALEGLYKILTQSIRNEAPHKEVSEAVDNGEGSFSDKEMAEILGTVFAKARWDTIDSSQPFKKPTTISEGMEAYYRVGPAYTYYTGRKPQDLGFNEAYVLGTTQGIVSALVTVDQMALGAAAWVGKKVMGNEAHAATSDTHEAETWTSKILNAGKSVLDPHTWAMAWQMLTYGLEHSTAEEKLFMVNKIVAEFISVGLIGGEVLHGLKASKLGIQGSRAMKSMTVAMEVIATQCPTLAMYGYNSERICVGLENVAAQGIRVWDDLLLRSAHVGETAHGVEANLYHPTVGVYSHAKEEIEAKREHSFAYDELVTIREHLRLAIQHAESLGLTEGQRADLQASNREVLRRLQGVDREGH
ncbi:hypothetical protein IPG41_04105 [Candidatus Peregrinibacteria bacterium]|nr:MAG: hypothetical protein IPG41_04105 [Candidatus Peregrinibacteria bacterium]